MPTLPNLDITTQVNHSPHVVILGAGGSKAAFPRGDPNGRVVPVMQQLVECLDLTASLKSAGFVDPTNFEAIYDDLARITSSEGAIDPSKDQADIDRLHEIAGRLRTLSGELSGLLAQYHPAEGSKYNPS